MTPRATSVQRSAKKPAISWVCVGGHLVSYFHCSALPASLNGRQRPRACQRRREALLLRPERRRHGSARRLVVDSGAGGAAHRAVTARQYAVEVLPVGWRPVRPACGILTGRFPLEQAEMVHPGHYDRVLRVGQGTDRPSCARWWPLTASNGGSNAHGPPRTCFSSQCYSLGIRFSADGSCLSLINLARYCRLVSS